MSRINEGSGIVEAGRASIIRYPEGAAPSGGGGATPGATLSTSIYSTPTTSTSAVVPAGAAFAEIVCWGAGGGEGFGDEIQAPGGNGGFVEATIPVTAGETLDVRVGSGGQDGTFPTAGEPGGGPNTAGRGFAGGSGGGYSGVFRGASPLVIAGGGGGGGVYGAFSSPLHGGHGSGYTTPVDPAGMRGGALASSVAAAGKGASGTTGGAGGARLSGTGTPATDGSYLQGGTPQLSSSDIYGPGGGGGGYYGGGGGGGYSPSTGAGGGGGNGYVDPSAVAGTVTRDQSTAYPYKTSNFTSGDLPDAPQSGHPDYVSPVALGRDLTGTQSGRGHIVIRWLAPA